MTESEALRIGREVVRIAQKKVGDDLIALEAELTRQREASPQVREAFTMVGNLRIQSEQAGKQ